MSKSKPTVWGVPKAALLVGALLALAVEGPKIVHALKMGRKP